MHSTSTFTRQTTLTLAPKTRVQKSLPLPRSQVSGFHLSPPESGAPSTRGRKRREQRTVKFLLCVWNCLGQGPYMCYLIEDTRCSEKEVLSCPFGKVENWGSESWSDLPQVTQPRFKWIWTHGAEFSIAAQRNRILSLCELTAPQRIRYREENPTFKARPPLT